MRYNARANIAPDEEFKRDISWIRKDAERKVLGALVKFHDRRVERSKSKLVKLEQESRKEKRKDMCMEAQGVHIAISFLFFTFRFSFFTFPFLFSMF